jgi:hypothetical protein
MKRWLAMWLGLAAAACTGHGEVEPSVEEAPERAEPVDRSKQQRAWLDARELPSLDDDPRVALIASPPACPPARPWTPTSLLERDQLGFFMIEAIDAFELVYGQPPVPTPALPSWSDIERDGCDFEFTNAHGELEWRSSRVGVELWLDRGASGSYDLRRLPAELPDEIVEQAVEACDVKRYQVIRPPRFIERGFRALHGLPLEGELRVMSLGGAIHWALGKHAGYERYEYSGKDTPVRVDGFDRAGVWRRSSLFTYDRDYAVRHDFDVVEGEAKLVASLLFDRSSKKVELARTPERVEYRRHVEHSGDWWALLVQRPEGITRHGTFGRGVERIVQPDGFAVDLFTDHEGRHWDASGHGHIVERCGLEAPSRPEWMSCSVP